MYILGIETSCDETSIAVLENFFVRSNITLSSLKEHKKYGGIIPEIAVRAHLKNIDKILEIALKEACVDLKEIDLIAVTFKPGLVGALLVGVNFAKALAFSLNIPFLGVNHLYAHLFSGFLNNNYKKIKFPFLGIVLSGGHSDFYYVKDFNKIRILGRTIDDACGEVYDKVARALELGYPGGPIIDRLFKEEKADIFKFKCGRKNFNLSFSGIKTAVIYKKKELEEKNFFSFEKKIELISSFQKVIIGTILENVKDLVKNFNFKQVVCGGGVVANSYLRKELISLAKKMDFDLVLSPLEYSTDNAAMVAGLGFYLYNRYKRQSNLKLKTFAN